jgi:hypothetical protein
MLTRWTCGSIVAGIVVCVSLTPPVSATVTTCPAPPPQGDAMDKIDDALRARLEAGTAGTVPVIVTLKGGIVEDQLKACGLDIAHRFPEIGAVSGTIAASEVPRLAALPEVTSVELDSEMRALNH